MKIIYNGIEYEINDKEFDLIINTINQQIAYYEWLNWMENPLTLPFPCLKRI